MSTDVTTAAQAVRTALARAGEGLLEREALLQAIALAAVAGEHVLVIGPPGTAKSEAVRRFTGAIGGTCFEYLLGRFTEPSEIFGPVDLRKLRDGVVETRTDGMLPEADVAFLDEVFQGSTAILNTLLGILNERRFRRGQATITCPLRLCVAASNALPEDEALAAFGDRFLLRLFVEPIGDTMLEDLLTAGWSLRGGSAPTESATLADLDLLSRAVRDVDLETVRPELATAVRLLRGVGLTLSDRRVIKLQGLVAAACVLDGRSTATTADLWPLVFAVPTAPEQALARDTLAPLLEGSSNTSLPDAAEAASRGLLARSGRLARQADELLQVEPGPDVEREAWVLQLESVLREIDATFASAKLPAELDDLRGRLVAKVGGSDDDGTRAAPLGQDG
ncbi:MAG: AAA family ATPase [Acidobacteriota bacterium]